MIYDKHFLSVCFKQHGKEKWLENEKLRRILQNFVSKMNDSFILVKIKEMYEYHLLECSEVLLSLAEQLETLLFDLDEDMVHGITELSIQ